MATETIAQPGKYLSLQDEILDLKEQRNAIILVHNYQVGDIQDSADYV